MIRPVELDPCPFCGGKAYVERFGNSRVSTVYVCEECGCRLETGETFNYGRQWNTRALTVAKNYSEPVVPFDPEPGA